MRTQERNSNFELLRIISMIFIILWHIYMFGNIRYGGQNLRIANESIRFFFEFIPFILIVHVNSFVILSGYFQSSDKFKLNKFFSLINETLFYKTVIVILFIYLGLIEINKVDFIRNFFLLNTNTYKITSVDDYWFIRMYLFLYILSPFLNKLITNLKKNEFEKMLAVLFLIFSLVPYFSGNKMLENYGYTLYSFIFLYLIGAYLRKYSIKNSYLFKKISMNFYRIILILIFTLCILFNYSSYKTTGILMNINGVFKELFGNINSMHFAYSNPFVIIQTISYFLFFESFDFKSKIINNISKLTFGVYLIHNNQYIRYYLFKWLKIDNGIVNSYTFIIYCFVMTFVIFILCSFIEWIRQKIFKFIYNRKISNRFRKKFYTYINSIKIEK